MIETETELSCMFIDVLKETLDTCSWEECSETCQQYLFQVAYECPEVFNKDVYTSLWNSLVQVCFKKFNQFKI